MAGKKTTEKNKIVNLKKNEENEQNKTSFYEPIVIEPEKHKFQNHENYSD